MNMLKRIGMTVLLVALTVSGAYAIPDLQLDIVGGTWINGTTYSASNSFTLQAYLLANPAHDNLVGDTYFISAALVPRIGKTDPAPVLGSFKYGAQTVNVASGMEYGTPPLDSFYPNLPDHGIYETYYKEFSFQFDSSKMVNTYNVQDNSAGPGQMYVYEIAIDTSGLKDGYFIHFDLYNENLITKKRCTDPDTLFAPFSHDAQSNGHKVLEPGTMALLGMGLVGLGIFGRRK